MKHCTDVMAAGPKVACRSAISFHGVGQLPHQRERKSPGEGIWLVINPERNWGILLSLFSLSGKTPIWSARRLE